MNEGMEERLKKKSGEQRLVEILQHDYRLPIKVAEAVTQDAQECLIGSGRGMGPGQVKVYLVRRKEPAGKPIQAMRLVEVIWTVDAGRADAAIRAVQGVTGLRQVREQRLLNEAIEQGAVATQEDLARVLHTSVRTVKRDFAEMNARGQASPSRGMLQGMGRGQSHKAQIIARWLRGESYDQLELSTRHAGVSIQRYIRTFVRVVDLFRRGNLPEQIAFLLQIGPGLVGEYLAVYQANDQPLCRARLQEQLQRLSQVRLGEKGGP